MSGVFQYLSETISYEKREKLYGLSYTSMITVWFSTLHKVEITKIFDDAISKVQYFIPAKLIIIL